MRFCQSYLYMLYWPNSTIIFMLFYKLILKVVIKESLWLHIIKWLYFGSVDLELLSDHLLLSGNFLASLWICLAMNSFTFLSVWEYLFSFFFFTYCKIVLMTAKLQHMLVLFILFLHFGYVSLLASFFLMRSQVFIILGFLYIWLVVFIWYSKFFLASWYFYLIWTFAFILLNLLSLLISLQLLFPHYIFGTL